MLSKNIGKRKPNMHQNKKKTCMRRTTKKEKQNLICHRKMHSNKTKHDGKQKSKLFHLTKNEQQHNKK